MTFGKCVEFYFVLQLVAEGRVPLALGKMYLDKSELARDLVETYFDLNAHLFIDYTHLVCRTALGTT